MSSGEPRDADSSFSVVSADLYTTRLFTNTEVWRTSCSDLRWRKTPLVYDQTFCRGEQSACSSARQKVLKMILISMRGYAFKLHSWSWTVLSVVQEWFSFAGSAWGSIFLWTTVTLVTSSIMATKTVSFTWQLLEVFLSLTCILNRSHESFWEQRKGSLKIRQEFSTGWTTLILRFTTGCTWSAWVLLEFFWFTHVWTGICTNVDKNVFETNCLHVGPSFWKIMHKMEYHSNKLVP